ncbi:MAG: lipoyl(octanoyl) transferase LipB [Planctomycetota bacterium]
MERVEVLFEDRGVEAYRETHRYQRGVRDGVISHAHPSTLIQVTHPPVITIGRSGAHTDILAGADRLKQAGIECIDVERGGKVTYHGPGQVVFYPVFDLRAFGRDINLFLRSLERVVITALAQFGITAVPGPEAGIFAGGRKVGSIGIAVRRWVSWHGVSLNVRRDANFGLIRPCGLSADQVTSIKELGADITVAAAGRAMTEAFIRELGLSVTAAAPDLVESPR